MKLATTESTINRMIVVGERTEMSSGIFRLGGRTITEKQGLCTASSAKWNNFNNILWFFFFFSVNEHPGCHANARSTRDCVPHARKHKDFSIILYSSDFIKHISTVIACLNFEFTRIFTKNITNLVRSQFELLERYKHRNYFQIVK